MGIAGSPCLRFAACVHRLNGEGHDITPYMAFDHDHDQALHRREQIFSRRIVIVIVIVNSQVPSLHFLNQLYVCREYV